MASVIDDILNNLWGILSTIFAAVVASWLLTNELSTEFIAITVLISAILAVILIGVKWTGLEPTNFFKYILKRLIGYSYSEMKLFRIFGFDRIVRSLRNSDYVPKRAMEKTDNELHFMGCLGYKWVRGPEERDKFETFLSRMDANDGTVRFLIADTDSEGYSKLSELRNLDEQTLSDHANHYHYYEEYHSDYDCIEVRLFTNIPIFRLLFIDDSVVISRYRYEDRDIETDRAWENIPHLEINTESTWTLHDPLEHLFEYLWNQAEPIDAT